MALMTYLHADPKTGVYRYRRRVPDLLRPIIGKREIKEMLGTKNPKEAKRRATARNLIVEATIIQPAEKALEWGCSLEEAHRRLASDRPPSAAPAHLTAEDLDAIGEWVVAQELELDDLVRNAPPDAPLRAFVRSVLKASGGAGIVIPGGAPVQVKPDAVPTNRFGLSREEAARLKELIATWLDTLRQDQALANPTRFLGPAEAIACKLGIDPQKDPGAVVEIARELLRANVAAADLRLRRLEGEAIKTPKAVEPGENRFTVTDALKLWRRVKKPKVNVYDEAEFAVRQFRELHGGPTRQVDHPSARPRPARRYGAGAANPQR